MTKTLDPAHGARQSVCPRLWKPSCTVALVEAIMRSVFGGAATALLFIAICSDAEPFVPKQGCEVLERLPGTILDTGARELRELRKALDRDPQNLALAAQYARNCIQDSRNCADPRYLGRAEAALAPWWHLSEAPPEVLVLRAILRQSQHDFTNALMDLDTAITRAPRDAQAWLTRATILTVVGDYPAARRACIPLAQLTPGLVALTAAANVACLNGEAQRGCALLGNALSASASASTSERVWALTVLGEAYSRVGKDADAEKAFRKALELEPNDAYLLCSYSDLLLDLGRPQETVTLLRNAVRSDGVLLRLALAHSKLGQQPNELKTLVSTLRDRFEAGHLRGDFVHQREEARFALDVLGAPAEALRLAQDNWRVQREPADARMFVESALAALKPAAAQPVLEFIRTNHIQDVRLQGLANRIESSNQP
jgi:tetratricopeptide (TPR) repeat protein